MTKEQYIKITEPWRGDEEKTKRIKSTNSILTAVVFFVYPLYLLVLFLEKEKQMMGGVVVLSVLLAIGIFFVLPYVISLFFHRS